MTMHASLRLAAAAGAVMAAAVAHAGIGTNTFPVTLTPDTVVPGPGNPGAIATGVVSVNTTTNEFSWDIVHANLQGVSGPDDITGLFLRTGGPAGVGPLLISLGMGADDLGSRLMGTRMATPTQVNSFLADPGAHYIEIRTEAFPNGAVRAQIPAPASAIPLMAAAGLLTRRRRRA